MHLAKEESPMHAEYADKPLLLFYYYYLVELHTILYHLPK